MATNKKEIDSFTREFSSLLHKRFEPHRNGEALSTVIEKNLKVDKLRLVNQSAAFRIHYNGKFIPEKGVHYLIEPREVMEIFSSDYEIDQRTPKTFSCIILKLNNTTLTVSTGGENASYLRVNIAGKGGHESFIYAIHLLIDEIEKSLKGKIVFTSIDSKVVNRVIVIYLPISGMSIETLIEKKMDKIEKYKPNGFPGANFDVDAGAMHLQEEGDDDVEVEEEEEEKEEEEEEEEEQLNEEEGVSENKITKKRKRDEGGDSVDRNWKKIKFDIIANKKKKNDCTNLIAFTTGRVTLLGVKDLVALVDNFPERLKVFYQTQVSGIPSNSKLRQKHRVDVNDTWKAKIQVYDDDNE